MYSFLVIISSNQNSNKLLSKSRKIIDEIIPRIDVELSVNSEMVAENQIGYYIYKPSINVKNELFHRFSDDILDVFFFGELFDTRIRNSAKIISDVFCKSGITSTRLLEGNYSAIIMDKKNNLTYVISDIIGRRKLRYYDDGENLLISNHDMPILATGKISTEVDLTSIYSILAFDWSLNGMSLLKKISVIQPFQYLRRGTYLEVIDKPLLHKNYKQIETPKSIDDIVSTLKSNVKNLSQDVNEIHIDLTAGLDSRTILAIGLSVINHQHIKTFTLGEKDNIEVKIAKKISEYFSINHSIPEQLSYNVDEFINHSNLFAYFINGDSNSIRAVHSLPKFTDMDTLKLNGLGGEIFTGYYYPILKNKNLAHLIDFFSIKKNKALYLEVRDDSIREAFKKRVESTILKLNDFTSNKYDLTDLYYLYERFGNWGATLTRSSWNLREISIFASPTTIYNTFNSRTPIGDNHFLHNYLLKKYLRKFFTTPINNNLFDRPALYYLPKIFLPYLILTQRIFSKIQSKLKYFQRNSNQSKSHNQIRSDLFRDQLYPLIESLLLSDNNISSALLTTNQIKNLLSEHKSNIKDNSQILGKLVTIENWYKMVNKVIEKLDTTDFDTKNNKIT